MENLNRALAPVLAPVLALALTLLLAGCGSMPPERRYDARELQALRPAQFAWPAAAADARARQLAAERERLRARLALQPGAQREAELPAALQAALLFGIEHEAARAAVLAELPALPGKPPEFQHALLGAAHALAAREAGLQLQPGDFATPREFAMAAYLVIDAEPARAAALRAELTTRPDDPRLRALAAEIDRRLGLGRAKSPPPLAQLLAAPLLPGRPVVFSIQRPGREFVGLALVRRADGFFRREPDGRLLAIPQLARSSSAMPGTITLGNTPQGLFAIRGAGTATNPWIGPTPYLHSMLPIEASVAEFLDDPRATVRWTETLYRRLIPEAWQDALMEAWWAGQAGRSEILLHGTTIDPAWYAGRSFWPGTPSAGCLVADEAWNPQDGQLQRSDQLRLVQAFGADGIENGMLVVAELPGQGPVGIDEIEKAVDAAEMANE